MSAYQKAYREWAKLHKYRYFPGKLGRLYQDSFKRMIKEASV